MAARSACAWIIRELRRKVNDVGPEDLDDGVLYAGDTARLKCVYYDLTSTAVNPTTPLINIWDSEGTLTVTNANTSATATTGVQIYDYTSSMGAVEGVWRAQFQGVIGGVTSMYTKEFELRKTQRLWSDDDLQNYLDKHMIHVGLVERELLTHDAGYLIYISEYDSFEEATIYNSQLSSGTAVTPSTSNLVAGKWTFTSAQNKELYLYGVAHNIYAAAADLLFELAGDPSRAYQWSRGGVSQRSVSPLELANQYRYMAHGGQSVEIRRVY